MIIGRRRGGIALPEPHAFLAHMGGSTRRAAPMNAGGLRRFLLEPRRR